MEVSAIERRIQELTKRTAEGQTPANNPTSASGLVLTPGQAQAVEELTPPPVIGGPAPANNPASSSAPTVSKRELLNWGKSAIDRIEAETAAFSEES